MKFSIPFLTVALMGGVFQPVIAAPAAEAFALAEPNAGTIQARGLFDGTKSVSIGVALNLVVQLTTQVTAIEAQINATISALGKSPTQAQKNAAISSVSGYMQQMTMAITNTTGQLGLAANNKPAITARGESDLEARDEPTLLMLAQAIEQFLIALIATVNSALKVLGAGLAGIICALAGAISGLICVLVTLVNGLLPVLTKLLDGIYTSLVGILAGLIF